MSQNSANHCYDWYFGQDSRWVEQFRLDHLCCVHSVMLCSIASVLLPKYFPHKHIHLLANFTSLTIPTGRVITRYIDLSLHYSTGGHRVNWVATLFWFFHRDMMTIFPDISDKVNSETVRTMDEKLVAFPMNGALMP